MTRGAQQVFLRELREVFRARMRDADFCIGEREVEKLFRELLNEPEPARETSHTSSPVRGDIGQTIARAWEDSITDHPALFDSPAMMELMK